MDFGVKLNILRSLARRGMDVTVVPGSASVKDILATNPDGVMLSNGPGDPAAVTDAIETVRGLVAHNEVGNRLPVFGICLGHQLMGLALGGKTFKLKFGHRGANHPVKDITTGKVEITTQNHGFCVDIDSLAGRDVELTHVNLNDGTLEGFRHKKLPLFCVQHHPEAFPGPHDSSYLFDRFADLIRGG
jgi:carbamoyl-phosphate synthase small subunit